MMTPGVDEFGLSRSERIAMADSDLADAREMAGEWQYPDGFPTRGIHDHYLGRLNSAAALYHAEGLKLLARRVASLARQADVPRGWATFDRLNSKARTA